MKAWHPAGMVGVMVAGLAVVGCAETIAPGGNNGGAGGNGGSATTSNGPSAGFGATTSAGFGATTSAGFGATTSATVGATTSATVGATTSAGFGATTGAAVGATTSAAATTSASSGSTGPVPAEDPNALMCPGKQCTLGTPPGGYLYSYHDTGPSTTIGLSPDEACAAGTTTAVNPPSYSYYGAAIGINLGPSVGTADPTPFQLTGTGISIQLSNLPSSGARVLLNSGGTDYCAVLKTASQTFTWADFSPDCYDTPPTMAALAAAPATPHIAVQVVSGTAASSFNFCIEKLTL